LSESLAHRPKEEAGKPTAASAPDDEQRSVASLVVENVSRAALDRSKFDGIEL
jgi:hypothetical protein